MGVAMLFCAGRQPMLFRDAVPVGYAGRVFFHVFYAITATSTVEVSDKVFLDLQSETQVPDAMRRVQDV
jgi:hypothetical protein